MCSSPRPWLYPFQTTWWTVLSHWPTQASPSLAPHCGDHFLLLTHFSLGDLGFLYSLTSHWLSGSLSRVPPCSSSSVGLGVSLPQQVECRYDFHKVEITNIWTLAGEGNEDGDHRGEQPRGREITESPHLPEIGTGDLDQRLRIDHYIFWLKITQFGITQFILSWDSLITQPSLSVSSSLSVRSSLSKRIWGSQGPKWRWQELSSTMFFYFKK